MRLPRWIWRLMRVPPKVAYALGLGPLVGRVVLLLTTKGRVSGRPHVTPLQYEQIDGLIHIGSARGGEADWYKNLEANPDVQVRVRNQRFHGRAETVIDTERVADFLEYKLKSRPRFVGALMRTEGLPSKPTRAQIEQYASNRAMVVIHPVEEN